MICFLDPGDLLDGDFHSQVSPGDHDAVRRGQDVIQMIQGIAALDLGNDEGLVPQGLGGFPHGFQVFPRFHKRLADRVHPLRQGEFQAPAVVFREGADAQVDAGKIESLAGAQLPSHYYAAVHHLPLDVHHLKLDEAVGQQQGVPRFHCLGQKCKGHRGAPGITDDFFRGQRKGGSRGEHHGLRGDLPEAHLGAGKVRQDGQTASRRPRSLAEVVHYPLVGAEIAMGKVDPGHIHPGLDHLPHDFGRLGGRADGGHNLGFMVGKLHLSLPSNKVTGLPGDGQNAVPNPAFGIQFFPLRYCQGNGHVSPLVIPVGHDHIGPAGHPRMHRVLSQQQAKAESQALAGRLRMV